MVDYKKMNNKKKCDEKKPSKKSLSFQISKFVLHLLSNVGG